MHLRLALLLLGLLLALGAGLLYLWQSPRLVDVSPPAGATAVPANTPLRLIFSRPMQAASVLERLRIDPPREGEVAWEGAVLTWTPVSPWPGGEQVEVGLRRGARAAGSLSLPTTTGYGWTFTIREPRLVYLFPADGPADIYAIKPASGQVERLSDSPGGVLDYQLSPAGTGLVYSASLGSQGSAIYWLQLESPVQAVDGALLVSCPQAVCRYPALSPNGAWLAYEQAPLGQQAGPRHSRVWLLPLEKSLDAAATPARTAQAFPAGEQGHRTGSPSWSPAGWLVFYDDDLAAFVIRDPRGGEIARLPGQTGMAGAWSPGGESYVFPEIFANELGDSQALGDLQPLPFSHLLRFDLPGSSPHDLTQMDYLEDTAPAYSPDGRFIAFARKYLDIARWTPGRQLWLMRADGSDARPLTQEPHYNHYAFAWRPDGGMLAYVRFNQTVLTEPPEIWLISPDGNDARRLVSGGYAPQWIP